VPTNPLTPPVRVDSDDNADQGQLQFDRSDPSLSPEVSAADHNRIRWDTQKTRDAHQGAGVGDPGFNRTNGRPGNLSDLPLLLTVRDVEAQLQLGRTRTYELLRGGEIPVMRLGRALRVPRDALRNWIAGQTV
jgi:excisionase family DNA binding protein